MTRLGKQMQRDMILGGFSPRTREAYVGAVAALAKHYQRSPDQMSHQEIQTYPRPTVEWAPGIAPLHRQ
ncbi:MAG: phage integrase N-terminal SAM-like domain-containing protein [Candidatus Eisenbacteria sp.]|nr:phage integrase N-terminal SAM-like domain-containing protein [Candidatus Eisenbacteria bacterium]